MTKTKKKTSPRKKVKSGPFKKYKGPRLLTFNELAKARTRTGFAHHNNPTTASFKKVVQNAKKRAHKKGFAGHGKGWGSHTFKSVSKLPSTWKKNPGFSKHNRRTKLRSFKALAETRSNKGGKRRRCKRTRRRRCTRRCKRCRK